MRLSKRAAFYLQASIVLFFLAGSSAPTPLYSVYQAAWHFSPITVTVVFGIYALAVLAMLLTVGSLSDSVGRRPVLLITTLAQAVAMLLFIGADGVGGLIAARVLQGLATGAAAGAVGAGMLDLDHAKGTAANSVLPMLGTATGGMLSGIMVQYLPAPTKLVYALLGVVFVVQAVGVAAMPESVTPKPFTLASLRPDLRMPPAVRHPMLFAVPAMISAWALVGFYGALAPSLVRRLAGSNSLALGGITLAVLAASGVLSVAITQRWAARRLLRFGTGTLVVGVAVTLVGIASWSMVVFLLGTAIAGVGFGGAFQGAIRSVVPVAAAHERAGVLSVLYVIAYVSMGLPAVLGGVRVVYGGGLLNGARDYGLAVMALSALAWIGTRATNRDTSAPSLARDAH